MKTITLITALAGLCAVARGENLQTIDGATYQNFTRQRVDPDGLVIEYFPEGGGLGVAKVKFARLSPDQQRQFGYDPAKAGEYEAQSAKAAWRTSTARHCNGRLPPVPREPRRQPRSCRRPGRKTNTFWPWRN